MDDNKSNVGQKNVGTMNVNLSAGDNKIKYYECDDNNCIFEILDNNGDKDIDLDSKKSKEIQLDEKIIPNRKNDFQYCDSEKEPENNFSYTEEKTQNVITGEIIIRSILECGQDEEVLQGVKINLYKINGLSPILINSKNTDSEGKVVFSNIEEGCYRVIEIVDKRYFEKPKYINWNEITIDNNNRRKKILVVNKIKKFAAGNKHS